MESTTKLLSPLISVTSHGVETARYNSLLSFSLDESKEFALYTCGNRLILYDFDL